MKYSGVAMQNNTHLFVNNTRLFVNNLLERLREDEPGMFVAEEMRDSILLGSKRQASILRSVWESNPVIILVEQGSVYIRLHGHPKIKLAGWTFAAEGGNYFEVDIPTERQEDISILAAVIYKQKQ